MDEKVMFHCDASLKGEIVRLAERMTWARGHRVSLASAARVAVELGLEALKKRDAENPLAMFGPKPGEAR